MSKNTTESKFDVQQCRVVQKYRHETLGRRERKQTGSDSIQDANCCPIRCDTMIQRERERWRERLVVSLDCLTVCFANGNDLNSLGQNSSTRHGELRHQHSRSACLTVHSSLSPSLSINQIYLQSVMHTIQKGAESVQSIKRRKRKVHEMHKRIELVRRAGQKLCRFKYLIHVSFVKYKLEICPFLSR